MLANLKDLEHLLLAGCDAVTEQNLESLADLRALQHLDLSGCVGIRRVPRRALRRNPLQALCSLPNLRSLDLSRTRIDACLFAELSSPTLRCLRLASCPGFAAEAAVALGDRFPGLTELDLTHTASDEALEHVGSLVGLEDLTLAWSPSLSARGIAHLESLPALQRLDLAHCALIDDAALVHIGALGSLSTLSLAGCRRITDEGLGALGDLPHLSSLDVTECRRLTAEGLRRLPSSLEKLEATRCPRLDGQDLQHLAEKPLLAEVNLGPWQLSAAGIAGLLAAREFCLIHLDSSSSSFSPASLLGDVLDREVLSRSIAARELEALGAHDPTVSPSTNPAHRFDHPAQDLAGLSLSSDLVEQLERLGATSVGHLARFLGLGHLSPSPEITRLRRAFASHPDLERLARGEPPSRLSLKTWRSATALVPLERLDQLQTMGDIFEEATRQLESGSRDARLRLSHFDGPGTRRRLSAIGCAIPGRPPADDVLYLSIRFLEISSESVDLLEAAGLWRVGDLLLHERHGLLAQGFPPDSIAEVQASLRRIGLTRVGERC